MWQFPETSERKQNLHMPEKQTYRLQKETHSDPARITWTGNSFAHFTDKDTNELNGVKRKNNGVRYLNPKPTTTKKQS